MSSWWKYIFPWDGKTSVFDHFQKFILLNAYWSVTYRKPNIQWWQVHCDGVVWLSNCTTRCWQCVTSSRSLVVDSNLIIFTDHNKYMICIHCWPCLSLVPFKGPWLGVQIRSLLPKILFWYLLIHRALYNHCTVHHWCSQVFVIVFIVQICTHLFTDSLEQIHVKAPPFAFLQLGAVR